MKKIVCLAVGLVFMSSMSAMAVPVNNQILNADPGKIDALRLDDFKRIKKEKEEKKKEESNFDNLKKNTIEKNELKKTPEFVLNEVQFVGNTVIESAKLQAVVDEYIGKKITVNDLLIITKKVTGVYQEKGFLTSMAYLPPQKISKGIAKIEILEGKIGSINIKGNKWYKTRYLKKNILGSNDLLQDHVLNVSTIRSSLDELNASEHLKGKVIIEESEDPEFIDLTLEVDDNLPLNFGVTWDNQGRELIGTQRALITVSHDNIFGFGDQLYAGTALADGTFGLNTGYNIPIGTKGTKLNFDYSYSHINIKGGDAALRAADINGASNNYSVSLTKPFIKKYDTKLYGRIGFDMRDARTYQKNTPELFSKYNLRVLRTGLYGIKDDSKGRWLANSTVSTGIPILGARDNHFLTGESTNNVGTNKFVKMQTGVTRVHVLPKNSLGIFKISGQWASRRLLAAEQFQAGGVGTVRGYEEGFILGDWGLLSSIEVRTPVPFLKKILPEKLAFIERNIKWANFVDFGYTEVIHRAQNSAHNTLICGIGTGLNLNLFKYLNANVYMGIPIGHQKRRADNVTYDGQSVRVHFNLTSDIY